MKKKNHSSTILALTLGLAALPNLAHATATIGQSFTPTSVLMPIYAIGLVDSSGNTYPIYTCSGKTDSACSLDIANPTTLSAFFGPIPAASSVPTPSASATGVPSTTPTASTGIAAGSYVQTYLDTCLAGGGNTSYTLQVQGSASLGGTTYYTSATSGSPLTTSSSSEGYVSFTVSGCRTKYNMPGGVTIASGATQTLNLITNVSNFAYMLNTTTGSSGTAASMCSNGTTNSVCFNYPFLVPYVGTGTPTRETYYITNSVSDTSGANAYAQFDFYITPSGTGVIGGTSRALYNASTNVVMQSGYPVANPTGTQCTPTNGTAGACSWKINPFSTFKNVSLNTDGTTYTIYTYSGDSTAPSDQFTASGTTDVDVYTKTFTRISTAGGTPVSFTMTSLRKLFDAAMSDAGVVVSAYAVRIQ